MFFYCFAHYLLCQNREVSNNPYNTVTIGNQTWMTDNLDVEKFQNGDLIRQSKDQFTWDLANEKKMPTWCFYEFNSSNQGMGKVYNYYAVIDSRVLAPIGFHIATSNEWYTLNSFSENKSVRTSFAQKGFYLNENKFVSTPWDEVNYGPWWPSDKQNLFLFISGNESGDWDGQVFEYCATVCLPNMGANVRCIKD